MTYSNAVNQRQTLLDFSLIPLMTSISERLSMPDFVPSSQEVKYDLSDYLRGSDLERANIYKTLNSIVDPVTGLPATGVDSATVLAAEGGLADALATALLVRGPAGLAAETLNFAFDRTASRLIEMRSHDYLALPHGRIDSSASGDTTGLVET